MASFFISKPALFHTFGLFNATFIYSVMTLGWIDRENSHIVPQYSMAIVVGMVIASMIAFARLVRGVSDLLITHTLRAVGDHGRVVLRQTFDRVEAEPTLGRKPTTEGDLQNRPVTQTLRYMAAPQSIAGFDDKSLVELARQFDALIEIDCAVGDTIVYGTRILRIRGAVRQLPENLLWRAIGLSDDRTFEQDPKYPIRLLVDIAIKALSPAINDPTTAVQAIDQLEDLLRRIGLRNLEDIHAQDDQGVVRLIYRMPSWEDFEPCLR